MTRELRAMPAVYHASENLAGARSAWGNAIISRHRLFEAKSIANAAGKSLGVWATAVVDGRKFRVGCAHPSANDQERNSLVNAWEDAGRPPIILGVAGNQRGVFDPSPYWTDALRQLAKVNSPEVRAQYLFASESWKVIDGGAADAGAIWISAGKP
jgi:hypothetical protein